MKKSRRPTKTAKDGSGRVKEGPSESIRERYSFAGGVRGKYAARYEAGSNVVILDPDIAKVFRTSEVVNRILRAHMKEAT